MTKIFQIFMRMPLFSGGFLLMFSAWLMGTLRSWHGRGTGWIRSRFVVEIEVRDNEQLFRSIMAWLHQHPYTGRCRRLVASSLDVGLASAQGMDVYSGSEVFLTPASGAHFFLHNGRPLWITRQAVEAKMDYGRPVEKLILRAIGTDRKAILDVLAEVESLRKKRVSDEISTYVAHGGDWMSLDGVGRRSMDSVILRRGLAESICRDMDIFMASRNRYHSLGVPYHRGYLLSGPPGTGKTSLISALATHYKMPLFALNLSAVWSDSMLAQLVRNRPSRSILMIEDVDAAKASLNRQPQPPGDKKDVPASVGSEPLPQGPQQIGVSLSGLLNVLDGIFAKDGAIVFMTTNHPDRMDAALLRPGRIDLHTVLTYAVTEQATRLARRFMPDGCADEIADFASQCEGQSVSMAELQGQLICRCFEPAVSA